MFVCPECGSASPVRGFCTEHGVALSAAGDDRLLGASIGSHRIARLIGRGGMGEVYLAVHPQIGSRVAVKVLAPHCALNPQLVERFFAEARAVNVIRHEGIVNVLDLAQLPDGRPYIVMEFLDGASLSDVILGGGPLPIGGVVDMTLEVLDVLKSVHAHGITHRDLKPDNVFITAAGRAKVLDFGIAKLRPERGALDIATRTGALLGTPHYMSPEQAQGRPVDHRSDLYSTGVILYEALTGARPFEAEALFDLLRLQIEAVPRPPRALRPEILPALEQIVLRTLQKDPALRFRDAGELARALSEVSRALPPASFAPLALRGSARVGAFGPRSPVPELGRTAGAPSLATGDPTPHVPYAPPRVVAAPRSNARLFGVLGALGLAFAVLVLVAVAVWRRSERADASANGTSVRLKSGSVVVDQGGGSQTAPVNARRSRRAPPRAINAAHFELDGHFDAALDLARATFRDAELVMFAAAQLRTDGTADLTGDDAGVTWMFQSAEQTPKAPASGAPPMGRCAIVVNARRGRLEAVIPPISPCAHSAVALPSCRVKQVVDKGLLGRSPKEMSVTYRAFGSQGRMWHLSVDGSTLILPDEC